MVRTVPALSDKEATGEDDNKSRETVIIYTGEQREAIEDIQGALDDDDSGNRDMGLAALGNNVMRLCRLVIPKISVP